jgi:hypothetical protein
VISGQLLKLLVQKRKSQNLFFNFTPTDIDQGHTAPGFFCP